MPRLLVPQDGVEDDKELALVGDQGLLGRFTGSVRIISMTPACAGAGFGGGAPLVHPEPVSVRR